MPLGSSLFRNDEKLQACLTSDAAHVVPGAAGVHVGRIQKALELVFDARIDVGESKAASYGKSTADAVLAYKKARAIINRSYQTQPDNIVGKMTIKRLDDDILSLDKAGVIEKAYATIPAALALVRSAKVRLVAVRASFAPGALSPDNPEKKVLAWNFRAHRAASPLAQIDRVLAIYDQMEQALFFADHFRNQFDLFLFAPTHPTVPGAPAFTTLGGNSFEPSDKDATGDYKKAIYFTPEFANKIDGASIIVHELAHFCGGREGSPTSIEHRASPLPPPAGRQLEDGSTDYATMSPDDAFRNAQSYQAYCEPQTKGKPPAVVP